jgi:hypothetical protein
MQLSAFPIIVLYKVVIIIICFADNTLVKILENGKEVLKKVSEVKKDEMALVFDGKEKKYAKVIDNKVTEGEFEFYIIKVRSINDENKTKELKVTGEHVMITFDEKKEHKLIIAKELKGNEIVDTDDGFYKIYEIGKEIRKNKYMLSVKGGAVLANGIFVSTVCSDNDAKVIKPTLEEWEKYQNE